MITSPTHLRHTVPYEYVHQTFHRKSLPFGPLVEDNRLSLNMYKYANRLFMSALAIPITRHSCLHHHTIFFLFPFSLMIYDNRLTLLSLHYPSIFLLSLQTQCGIRYQRYCGYTHLWLIAAKRFYLFLQDKAGLVRVCH